MKLYLRLAWRNLWRNKRRTIITLVSIAFGVFMAVMLTGMNDRSWTDVINLAARMGGGHITIQHPEYLDAPSLKRSIEDVARVEKIARGIWRIIWGDRNAHNAAFITLAPFTVTVMVCPMLGASIATVTGSASSSLTRS